MALTLTLRQPTTIPLELRELLPGTLARLDQSQIQRWPLKCGTASVPLGELFDVSGDAADGLLVFEGDLSHGVGVGTALEAGTIRVRGSVGSRVGASMRGGQLLVEGNAGNDAGLEMRGGVLVVEGSVGDNAGGHYVGRQLGMRGGVMVIRGDAGDRLGCRMRRGMIALAGECGELAGWGMNAGTLCLGGSWGAHLAVGMKRGTIVLGGRRGELPAYFGRSCQTDSVAWRLIERQLHQHTFDLGVPDTVCELYLGDQLEGGRGELLLWPGD